MAAAAARPTDRKTQGVVRPPVGQQLPRRLRGKRVILPIAGRAAAAVVLREGAAAVLREPAGPGLPQSAAMGPIVAHAGSKLGNRNRDLPRPIGVLRREGTTAAGLPGHREVPSQEPVRDVPQIGAPAHGVLGRGRPDGPGNPNAGRPQGSMIGVGLPGVALPGVVLAELLTGASTREAGPRIVAKPGAPARRPRGSRAE